MHALRLTKAALRSLLVLRARLHCSLSLSLSLGAGAAPWRGLVAPRQHNLKAGRFHVLRVPQTHLVTECEDTVARVHAVNEFAGVLAFVGERQLYKGAGRPIHYQCLQTRRPEATLWQNTSTQ